MDAVENHGCFVLGHLGSSGLPASARRPDQRPRLEGARARRARPNNVDDDCGGVVMVNLLAVHGSFGVCGAPEAATPKDPSLVRRMSTVVSAFQLLELPKSRKIGRTEGEAA